MPSKLNLDYFYGNEAKQYSLHRVAKTLFVTSVINVYLQ